MCRRVRRTPDRPSISNGWSRLYVLRVDEELRDIQARWTALGQEDPFWAALTDSKSGPWSAEAFARDGQDEILRLLDLLERRAIPVRLGTALDFGCGPGRLTGGLVSAGFRRATGVDISEPMLACARETFTDPGCTFLLNRAPDLACIPSASMDLVYSSRVLQHMPTDLARGYIREFLRVCSPEGVVAFQLPTGPRPGLFQLAHRLLPDGALNRLRHGMAMHAIEVDDVIRLIASSGGSTLWVEADASAGPRWISKLYVARPSVVNGREPC